MLRTAWCSVVRQLRGGPLLQRWGGLEFVAVEFVFRTAKAMGHPRHQLNSDTALEFASTGRSSAAWRSPESSLAPFPEVCGRLRVKESG